MDLNIDNYNIDELLNLFNIKEKDSNIDVLQENLSKSITLINNEVDNLPEDKDSLIDFYTKAAFKILNNKKSTENFIKNKNINYVEKEPLLNNSLIDENSRIVNRELIDGGVRQPIPPVYTINTNNNNFSERQNKLQEIKETFKKPTKTSLSVIDKNIKTTKYTLGKKGKRVGVLIKNNITRKNIKEDLSKLKKNSIIEIKNYLRKHNLIKVGSNAPNDVLREIYEQSIMAGDIHNINDQNYLANNL